MDKLPFKIGQTVTVDLPFGMGPFLATFGGQSHMPGCWYIVPKSGKNKGIRMNVSKGSVRA